MAFARASNSSAFYFRLTMRTPVKLESQDVLHGKINNQEFWSLVDLFIILEAESSTAIAVLRGLGGRRDCTRLLP